MSVSYACAPGRMPTLRPHTWGQCPQHPNKKGAAHCGLSKSQQTALFCSQHNTSNETALARRRFENTKRFVQLDVLDAKLIVPHDVLGVLQPPSCQHRSRMVWPGHGASLTQDPEGRPLDIPEGAPAPALLTPPLAGLVAAAAHKGCKLAVGHLELAGPELRHLSSMHTGRAVHNEGQLRQRSPLQTLLNGQHSWSHNNETSTVQQ